MSGYDKAVERIQRDKEILERKDKNDSKSVFMLTMKARRMLIIFCLF